MAPVIARQEAMFICPADNEPDTHTHRAEEALGVTDKQNAHLFPMLAYARLPV